MKKAFTLIELLLVLSVIGLILTLSFTSYGNTQKAARDAKRKADLEQIRAALEQYKSVKNAYPSTVGSWYGRCSGSDVVTNDYVPNLVPDYIPQLPREPRESSEFKPCGNPANSCYRYRSDGVQYKIIAHCGVESQVTVSGSTVTCTITDKDPYYDPKHISDIDCSYQISSSETARQW